MANRKTEKVFQATQDVIAQLNNFDLPKATGKRLSQIDRLISRFLANGSLPERDFIVSMTAELHNDPMHFELIDTEIRYDGGILCLGGGGYVRHPIGCDSYTTFQIQAENDQVTSRNGLGTDLLNFRLMCGMIFEAPVTRPFRVIANIYAGAQ